MERETFERVWQRVQGTESLPERLLREEAESAALYGWLSRRCPSCGREAAALQREALQSLRQLRREFFVQSGRDWESPPFAPPERGVLPALRQQYRRETEGAAAAVGALRASRLRRSWLLRQLLLRITR